MIKASIFGITALFCFNFTLKAQDLGYNTKDIGLEYVWVKDNPAIDLQMAFNAKIHHSFIASIGYKQAWRHIPNTNNDEKGKGFGGSIGYRYYFKIIPKGIYLGARAYVWSFSMYKTADNASYKTNLAIAQPSAELGYTAVINDMAFITFYYSAGKQFQLNTEPSYGYGKSSVSSFGISGGIRF